MEQRFGSRLKHAWDVFRNREPTDYRDIGPGYPHRPDRPRMARTNERSLVTSIYNRIALDAAAVELVHCKVDENEQFVEKVKNSSLNEIFDLEANIDQTGRSFRQDIYMSMFDEGAVAIVPVETDLNPDVTGGYKIHSMRTGKILEWHPQHVRVRVYDERCGEQKDITVPKRTVGIVENPWFAVMNEPNSTMQRLIRKLNILDAIDEQSGSGKLDMIIQLPYTIKSEVRRQQADKRRQDIEEQLKGPYGIAYTDATEKIVQLNRPIENNLMKQIEYLMSTLHSQLNINQSILDGTADEKTMLNYHNRTIEVAVSAVVDEMKRKFLTKTARSQSQTITFFRDPFKLVPLANIAQFADSFTRNEILTSNEVRQIIGMKPSSDPRANELTNSNLYHPEQSTSGEVTDPNLVEEAGVESPEMTENSESSEDTSVMDMPVSALR